MSVALPLSKKTPHLDRFVPSTLVLCFDHTSQAADVGDPEVRGQEQAPRYYHIKTPLTKELPVMYRFDLKGFSYGASKPIDAVWTGYLYNYETITKYEKCLTEIPNMKASSYLKDGHLHLKLGPINRYCNAFELTYQGHYSNALTGLKYDGYEVTVTCN